MTFASIGKTTPWPKQGGSLLELAEQAGLEPASGCRIEVCGACRTAVLSGGVAYEVPPTAEHAPDEALLCCARPTTDLVLDL
ncbi:2Fe-2S iron-sulfur cluster-binding protein [Caulobacter sp.]|uniref:2Fe-2S iron-sulfur cluster-binding protein n=1 Tax=Caulobacter sp. TaxID=78 RepID=UPI003BAD0734